MEFLDIIQNPKEFLESDQFWEINKKVKLQLNPTHKNYFVKVCEHLHKQYMDEDRQYRICRKFFELYPDSIKEARGTGISIQRFLPTSNRLNFHIGNFAPKGTYKCYPDEESWGTDGFCLDRKEDKLEFVDVCLKFGEIFEHFVKEKVIVFYNIDVRGYMFTCGTFEDLISNEYDTIQDAAVELPFYVYLYID